MNLLQKIILMRLFFIDKTKCDGCSVCLKACGNAALALKDRRVVIDYKKCNNCGDCFKICPKNCIKFDFQHITNEENSAQRREKALALSLEKVRAENKLLAEQQRLMFSQMRTIVERMPLAILVADSKGQVVVANESFIKLLDYETRQVAENVPTLAGAHISSIFYADVTALVFDSLHTGTDFMDIVIKLSNHSLNASIFSVSKSDMVMVMLRNIYDNSILKEEVTSRIESVIDQNMAMIQKIGFLMGEETSKTTKTLNSIIKDISK